MAKRFPDASRAELRFARTKYSGLNHSRLEELRYLVRKYKLSLSRGEITEFNDKWYVTHTGLLRLAFRRRCNGIETSPEERLCDPSAARWVFRAVVHKSRDSKPFVGYGDAYPSNVSIQVHGAEMRIAETRAVNRALRKAYGIGICSVEELGCSRTTDSTPNNLRRNHSQRHPNGSNNGQPRLRDQLSVLIRQHNLNPLLVKAYAADFCGTATLSDATRELIESFISHLSTAAKENRDGLLCKLNSYAQPVETQP
jgi:hypothetical protein